MLSVNFIPFPTLFSKQLNYREINENDVEQVFQMRSNPENMKFIPRPLLKNHQDSMEHIKIIK